MANRAAYRDVAIIPARWRISTGHRPPIPIPSVGRDAARIVLAVCRHTDAGDRRDIFNAGYIRRTSTPFKFIV